VGRCTVVDQPRRNRAWPALIDLTQSFYCQLVANNSVERTRAPFAPARIEPDFDRSTGHPVWFAALFLAE